MPERTEATPHDGPLRPATVRHPDVISRLAGVLFSPQSTFRTIMNRPRWLGALAVVALAAGGANAWLISTDVGRQALLELQFNQMETFGVTVSDEMYEGIVRQSRSSIDFAVGPLDVSIPIVALFTLGSQLVTIPILVLILAGVVWTVGYVVFGTGASFKALFAIVAHVGAVNVVQQMFVVPLNYIRGAISNPATIAAFFPMLDDRTFAYRALSLIDMFVVWQLCIVSIGIAVLYGRRTGPILAGFYTLYAIIAVGGGFALSRMGG